MNLKKNRLVFGAVLLLVAGAATMLALKQRTRNDAAAPSAAGLGVLEAGTITELTIDGIEDAPATVLRNVEGTWSVTAPVSAQADQAAVQAAVDRIAELTSIGVVSQNAENFERLGVTDATAIRVIAKAGDNVVRDVLIGSFRGGRTYVRLPEGTDVYGVAGSARYPFDRTLHGWRNKVIVAVDPANIGTLTIDNHATGKKFAFERNEASEWVVAAGSAAVKNFSAGAISTFVEGFARLETDGFAEPGVDRAAAGLTSPRVTVVATLKPKEGATAAPAPVALQLSNTMTSNDSRYAAVSGNDTIFTLLPGAAAQFDLTADSFTKAAEESKNAANDEERLNKPATEPLSPELIEQLRAQGLNVE